MLNAPHAMVIRDGKKSQINAEDLVIDDIVIFEAGNQVCADAEVCAGEVQVNESLLTGESDEITKTKRRSADVRKFLLYPDSACKAWTKWGRILIFPG